MLSQADLLKLIKYGESSQVELKIAAPRYGELAERIAGMVDAQARSPG